MRLALAGTLLLLISAGCLEERAPTTDEVRLAPPPASLGDRCAETECIVAPALQCHAVSPGRACAVSRLPPAWDGALTVTGAPEQDGLVWPIHPGALGNITVDWLLADLWPSAGVPTRMQAFGPPDAGLDWAWSFGDGGHATGRSVEHTFLAAGTYNVSLTATAPDGRSASLARELLVHPERPWVAIEVVRANVHFHVGDATPAGYFAGPGDDLVFRAVVTGPREAADFQWDLGDGTTARGAEVPHAYGEEGRHAVTLVVTDTQGAQATVRANVTVQNMAPFVWMTLFHHPGNPLNVSYTATAWDVDGDVVGTTWSFGDGATSEAPAGVHAFATPGNYTITLTVRDDDGGAAVAQRVLAVTGGPSRPGPAPR